MRNKLKNKQILLKAKNDITEDSFKLKFLNTPRELIVFDAARDNKGKGLKGEDILKILKKK